MVNRSFPLSSNDSGFTLIEMIGVLAIIAILIAAVSPRIFDAISDARITSCATVIKGAQTAVSKYYSDVGSLYPLSAAGQPTADATGALLPDILTGLTAPPSPKVGLWLKFNGPYLEKFASNNPSIGGTMTMPSVAGVAGAVANNNNTNYDLNNDGTGDFSATSQVVSLVFTVVSQKEFLKLDKILDEGVGTTSAMQEARGKVKWANGTMRVYLADK